MECFLVKWGSCSYDDESIDDIEVPLRYKHLVKQWVPKDIPQTNNDFCVNKIGRNGSIVMSFDLDPKRFGSRYLSVVSPIIIFSNVKKIRKCEVS